MLVRLLLFLLVVLAAMYAVSNGALEDHKTYIVMGNASDKNVIPTTVVEDANFITITGRLVNNEKIGMRMKDTFEDNSTVEYFPYGDVQTVAIGRINKITLGEEKNGVKFTKVEVMG